MSRLFIIGNGFDIAHGNKTSYRYFRDWLIEQLEQYGILEDKLDEIPEIPFPSMGHHDVEFDREETVKLLMWLLQFGCEIDEEWNEFEAALYTLDLKEVMDDNTMFEGPWGQDDEEEKDNELFHRAYNYEMYAEALRDALYQINDLFSQWIRTVELNRHKISFGWNVIGDDSPENQRRDDLFLTFNYTETLETLYGVQKDQICHIHGSRTAGDRLIIGHGNDQERGFQTEYIAASDHLEAAIRGLRKDTGSIIQNHKDFFEKIRHSDITEVYCFGFSFSDVDLPYMKEILDSLEECGKNVMWKLNSYSHDKNRDYEEVLQKYGYAGSFSEYDASKILIDKSQEVSALDPFDTDKKWVFYYDESNFFGKFWLKEDGSGQHTFNTDIDKDFVLAGLVVEPGCDLVDKDDLWKKLKLSLQITELKFTKQFSQGDFLHTIGKTRLYQLLQYIEQKNLFIHIAHVNSFYYAVVDIVDSAVSLEDIEEYRGAELRDIRYELNNFKAQLYKVLHANREAVEKLFSDYSYPDIDEESMEQFSKELVGIFGSRRELSLDMKFLAGMILKAGASRDLLFLRGNRKHIMIEDLMHFYYHFVLLFQNSFHIFDDQKEIRRKLEQYEFVGENSKILRNYTFADSKSDIMIQISDVISGTYAQLYTYINISDDNRLRKDVTEMTDVQLNTAALLWRLMEKSDHVNPGFIFSVSSIRINERVVFFSKLVAQEVEKRGT